MIEFIINSENSTEHWPYFNTENHNVLDLGCGKWFLYTDNIGEYSPIFFGRNANKVIGVDANKDDIDFYIEKTVDNPKYVFICQYLTNVDEVRSLLKEYSITALKSDIEGAESMLLDLTKEDLENVKEMAIEFHTQELKDAFASKVIDWGFQIKANAKFAQSYDYTGVVFCSK